MAVKAAPKTGKDYLNIFLVFFVSYFIYLLTIYPTVGSEDSGEILTSAATLDIVHPPGYPLHTLIGFLFSKLIFFGNIGWRVNILSAFFAAAAVTVLYLFIKRLTKNSLIAIGTSLLFAFSDIFWSQSIRTEVYTLCIFFLILICYLLLIWDEKQEDKYLYWTAFLYGLSWSNAYTIMALIGPPMVIYVLIRNWRVILKIKLLIFCILLFALGLSVYLYLPLRTWLGPYDNPAYIKHDGLHTWPQFWKFVNRSIYGGMVETLGTVKVDKKDPSMFAWIIGIFNYLLTFGQNMIRGSMNGLLIQSKIIIEQLIYLPIIFLVPGVMGLWEKSKKYSVFIFLGLFVYTVLQLMFVVVSANMSAFTAHNNRPFYIASTLMALIITAAGVSYFIEKASHDKLKQILLGLICAIPLAALVFNFSYNNESGNYVAYDFNKNVLASIPPNGYLVSIGRDNSTFPLYYLQKIEQYRKDVTVRIYYYANSPDKKFFETGLKALNVKSTFVDLLPNFYKEIGLKPYNFVFQYGDNPNLPPSDFSKYKIRGIRPQMDWPNTKLKAIYYIKNAFANAQDKKLVTEMMNKVKEEAPYHITLNNLVDDFLSGRFATGMF